MSVFKVEFFIESELPRAELENIFDLAIEEFQGEPPTYIYRRDISVEEQ